MKVSAVAISDDNSFIVSGSFDNIVRIWKRCNGKLLRGLKGHSDCIWSVSISKDKKMIASCSKDGTVQVWKFSGKLIHVFPINDKAESNHSVFFTPDPSCVISRSPYGSTRMWNIKDGICDTPQVYSVEKSYFGMQFTEDYWVKASNIKIFWLPPSFRPINNASTDMNDSEIAIVNHSGRIIIISLYTDNNKSIMKNKKKSKLNRILRGLLSA
ncbi:WD40-repeat-containing domain protein [Cyathus striatus]|nr:WD40-repeat-containing domain protein [Cyathus striatus]